MSLKSFARSLFSWSIRARFRRAHERLRNLQVRWRSGRPLSLAVQGQLLSDAYLRPTLMAMAEETTWCIDEFVAGDDFVSIKGWALTPFDQYAPATFTLNGKPFEEIHYPGLRADVGNVFWYRLGAAWSAFECRTPIAPGEDLDELFPNGFAEVQFCDARTLAPFRAEHGIYPAHPSRNAGPQPDPKQRARVHGSTDLRTFHLLGASAFVKLERTLNKTCGKGFSDFPRILDWGCGCGRLSRYFSEVPRIEFHGTDIDTANVEWCATHLPFGRFEPCDVDPPLPYPDGHFDLVFGISVMTHLLEADRTLWLEELDRVTADGAIVLLTVQGAAAVCRSSIQVETLIQLRQRGSLDVDVSLAAEDLSDAPSRYIDCFLLEEYIRDRWSAQFDVVDVVPAFIGNVQDLVVLRKKAG